MAPVDVQFAVSENDLAQLRGAMAKGTATVTVTPRDGSATATGPVSFLDSTVDRGSGTVQARGTLANADRALWPGESVSVALDLGERDGLTLVPTVAVVPQASGSIVYVVKPDQTIDVRTVQVADANADTTGLSTGVAPGEHVVSEGQFNLNQGQSVNESVVGAPGVARAGAAAPATAVRG